MIKLKELNLNNAKELKENHYKNKTISEVENIILSFKNKNINGKYFEMFGVFNGDKLVGIVSIAEQTKGSVSHGIEIFEKFRKLGFGFVALKQGFEIAKQKGYTITLNQVRVDNRASIALCKKCGLETNFYEYVNKKGNAVYLFLKQL